MMGEPETGMMGELHWAARGIIRVIREAWSVAVGELIRPADAGKKPDEVRIEVTEREGCIRDGDEI